jgi:hypothetical protein
LGSDEGNLRFGNKTLPQLEEKQLGTLLVIHSTLVQQLLHKLLVATLHAFFRAVGRAVCGQAIVCRAVFGRVVVVGQQPTLTRCVVIA